MFHDACILPHPRRPAQRRAALDDLDKRRENMRHGWLRRNGYGISSSHVLVSATMTRSFC